MGFAGLKISGHSGSEFKHRKAFSQRRTSENSASKTEVFALPIIDAQPTDYQKIYDQDRKLRLFFKLPLFLIALIVIGYVTIGSSSANKAALNAENNEQFNTVKETEIIQDYDFYINSGYYYLGKNKLNTAQREFTRALGIDEYNIDARIGLTKTMIERCKPVSYTHLTLPTKA